MGVLATLTIASGASASVDTTPKPGGTYPLKPGTYVQKGVGCGSAPNAAIHRYDGRGIASAHSRSCRVHVISRRGRQFEVTQSCIGAGRGAAPRFTEHQTVSVEDALTFTLRTHGSGTSYRYCPAYLLSADLQGAER